jgi:two-component system LytT family response regulator
LNTDNKSLLRTLIVDDEALARRGLRHRLSNISDVEIVAEARNGREALKAISELQPNLVFLDIQMPGMGGFEVVAELEPDNMPAIV